MAEQNTRQVEDPAAEIVASGGLITILGAMVAVVMAVVIALVALGDGSTASAGFLGGLALAGFAASLVCFAADRRRTENAPLPFPSWLRTDPGTAAELSAP